MVKSHITFVVGDFLGDFTLPDGLKKTASEAAPPALAASASNNDARPPSPETRPMGFYLFLCTVRSFLLNVERCTS